MQIGFLEIRKTNVNVYGDGVNFFLGKDMMTYSVTWVKGEKNDGLKSPRNARNFLPNKTSPLLRLCDPVSSSHLAFTPPSSPRLRRRLILAGTLNGPRRRRALLRPHRGGGLPRLPRPPRGHDQGSHHRYATRRWLPFAPDFACLSGRFAGADALLVLLVCADVEKFYQLCDPGESARSPRV